MPYLVMELLDGQTLSQSLFPDMNLRPFGQLFRGEGRSEVVPLRLL
jgi:hypothetical protein